MMCCHIEAEIQSRHKINDFIVLISMQIKSGYTNSEQFRNLRNLEIAQCLCVISKVEVVSNYTFHMELTLDSHTVEHHSR